MKLDKLFEMQEKLDKRIIVGRNVNKNLTDWVTGLTMAMESEIDEVRREVPWKWWKDKKTINHDKLQEEVVDIWHFLISLSIHVGLTPDKLMEKYTEKNKENHRRQNDGY